jgi:hypothetical protein
VVFYIYEQTAMPVEALHPVVILLNDQANHLALLNDGLAECQVSSPEERAFIRREYVPLADDLVRIGKFSLEPTDLLAIWKPVTERFNNLHLRYRLAGTIAVAFAVQATTAPILQSAPRTLLQTSELPAGAESEIEELEIIRQRLDIVRHNIGVARTDQPSELASELGENFANGLQTIYGSLYRVLGD